MNIKTSHMPMVQLANDANFDTRNEARGPIATEIAVVRFYIRTSLSC